MAGIPVGELSDPSLDLGPELGAGGRSALVQDDPGQLVRAVDRVVLRQESSV
jgi:hypothetical protein